MMPTTSHHYANEVQVNQGLTGKYDSKNQLVTKTSTLPFHKYFDSQD